MVTSIHTMAVVQHSFEYPQCHFPTSSAEPREGTVLQSISITDHLPGWNAGDDVNSREKLLWKAWAILLRAYTRSNVVSFVVLPEPSPDAKNKACFDESSSLTSRSIMIAQYQLSDSSSAINGVDPEIQRCTIHDFKAKRVNTGFWRSGVDCFTLEYREGDQALMSSLPFQSVRSGCALFLVLAMAIWNRAFSFHKAIHNLARNSSEPCVHVKQSRASMLMLRVDRLNLAPQLHADRVLPLISRAVHPTTFCILDSEHVQRYIESHPSTARPPSSSAVGRFDDQ